MKFGSFKPHAPSGRLARYYSLARWKGEGLFIMAVSGRVHFVGVGGYGMSPMARIMAEMGYTVTGSDISGSEKLNKLEALGVKVYIGHHPSNVDAADLVVATVAVARDNIELEEAGRKGIPVVSRAEMLGRLMNPKFGIAVTGTHGKTTTTAMVGSVLCALGLDPTVLIGGELEGMDGGGKLGCGEHFVAEADEAYGSFLALTPTIAVVTNIDNDHMDFYGDMGGILRAFKKFLSGVKDNGLVVASGDDENVRRLAVSVKQRKIIYGIHHASDIEATDIVVRGMGSEFVTVSDGKSLGRVRLMVPGIHNVQNALACVAVSLELGLSLEQVACALESFRGVRRRCEIVGDVGGITVIDDYAHHPTEIRATLRALKAACNGRLVAVFQPQRFTRTKLLEEEFARAFSDADIVLINEIYFRGTGEEPIPGVSGERLARLIESHEGRPVVFVPDREETVDYLSRTVRSGDVVVTMGAGNVWQVAKDLVRWLACERQVSSR